MTIQTIGVIGAGTMGNGIAQVCAAAGYRVLMLDINDDALERGLSALTRNLERQVSKQTLSSAQAEAAIARVQTSTDYSHLNVADIVVEAATENLELKLRILKQITQFVRPTCVIATNTSSLSITQLGASVDKPERFIGLHFFNPVPMMGLIEIIRGLPTSDAAHAQMIELSDRLGKTAINVQPHSLAKYAAAFFKMSRSSVTRFSSALRRRSSAC